MNTNIIFEFLNKYVTIQFIVQFLLGKILNKTLEIFYNLIGDYLFNLIDEKFLEYKDIIVSFLLIVIIFFFNN